MSDDLWQRVSPHCPRRFAFVGLPCAACGLHSAVLLARPQSQVIACRSLYRLPLVFARHGLCSGPCGEFVLLAWLAAAKEPGGIPSHVHWSEV